MKNLMKCFLNRLYIAHGIAANMNATGLKKKTKPNYMMTLLFS